MKYMRRWWLAVILCMAVMMGAGCAEGKPEEEKEMYAEEESAFVDAENEPVEPDSASTEGDSVQADTESTHTGIDGTEAGAEPTGEDTQDDSVEKEQEEQQKKLEELEALKAAFTDIETVSVYTTANVNVRIAPSTEAEIWQLVKRGTVFEKNGESEGWSRVVVDGNQYYIKSDYLREKRAPGEGSHMVAIDAGHQIRGNSEKEPIGPGAGEMKAKVTGGTRGTTTGLYEYELTLMVSEKLRDELENRGYTVYMVRESHDVDISNSERAQMAYDSGAEIFVRIHANGAENSNANGAMTICPTAQNPYIAHLYDDSQRLSQLVLDGLTASTGCRRERVWETDTMSGINWSQIPVTIVEMGYMTNPDEDRRMAKEDYQQQIAAGIADGIDWYFSD